LEVKLSPICIKINLFLGTSRNQSSDWPRLVEDPICKGGRVTCRICTSRGKLEEILATNNKDGKNMVRYCKSKQLGQQIKLNLNEKTQDNTLDDPQLEQILVDRKSKQLEQQIHKSKQLEQKIKLNLIDKSQHTLDPQLEQDQDDPDHN
jgi:ribosomal protein RSM22 (predicted rRNA methylase)